MRIGSLILCCVVPVLAFLGAVASAANPFAGSNLYYAAYVNEANTSVRTFRGLQNAGMKVLRVWLDGQSETQKGTNINPFPDLEPVQICNSVSSCYNDTVLDHLDEFMLLARSHDMKLLVDMHSFNALQADDVYGTEYGIADFYTNAIAQEASDARFVHVLNHVQTTLHQPWKELNEYTCGFEAENEAMIGDAQTFIEDHQQWQCDRANTIKTELKANTGVHPRPHWVVLTGGESWVVESVQPGFLNCTALDVISIHAYAVTDYYTSSDIESYVQQALDANTKFIVEEWGVCYYDTSNNDYPSGAALPTDTRNYNIQGWAANITAAGLPRLYWEAIPNADPHWGGDYEVGIVDGPSWNTLKQAARDALSAPAGFNFSEYLL
ncbi:glycoside hydrolase family 5 protein [Daedalea quercina L-15889]|uniref:Glycoside hydrolase family 5 protein n=1 Tax=Daedalea quercina L-15889 TaxID=1314783 RepID=A0A165P0W9_9APHY|nr:glycoside hydrolase family 5 protein [Daedalea quercina L-15889]